MRTAVAKSTRVKHSRSVIGRDIREFCSGFMYIFPALLVFSVFIFYPVVKTLYLSFFITDLQGNPVHFNGIQNFLDFFNDDDFMLTMKVTFLFLIYTVPTTIVISLFLAVLASDKLKFMQFFRVTFSSTMGVSAAAGAVMWLFLFHPSVGLFNHIMSYFNIPGVGWLTDPNWALISISVTTVWMHLGFNFLVLLGGIQNIPDELYESARIDGAGRWRQFRNITLPLLTPTLFFVTTVLMISSFQSFGQVDIMTGGGPAGSTNLIVYAIYRDAFINHFTGSASAQAIVLFILVLIVTLLQFKFGEKKVHYQ